MAEGQKRDGRGKTRMEAKWGWVSGSNLVMGRIRRARFE